MFSIRKLLGHDEKFFDLLEASAQQADSSVHELVALLGKLEHNDAQGSLEAFVHSRRRDKEITQQLTEQLVKTFITPLEREDIQALAAALYKIPKTVEKIGERIVIFAAELHGRSFKKHLELLGELFHGEYDTKQIIFLRDLYELLEKVIDRCRDAGNIILQVVLKYS